MYKVYKLIEGEFQLIHTFDDEDSLADCKDLQECEYGEDLIVLMNNKPLSEGEMYVIVRRK